MEDLRKRKTFHLAFYVQAERMKILQMKQFYNMMMYSRKEYIICKLNSAYYLALAGKIYNLMLI